MPVNKIVSDRKQLISIIKKNRILGAQLSKMILEEINKDEKFHFLSLSQEDPTKVSYAKRKEDKLVNEKRVKTTIGKYIRRQIDPDLFCINDTSLSNFSDYFTESVLAIKNKKDVEVSILKGNDIVDFYKSTGSILHTCMTGAGNSSKIKFYAMNPDKVSLVTTSNRKARALLWKTDDDKLVLDRVYPNAGVNRNIISAWGKNNTVPPNKKQRITMVHNNVFPYMDTFRYGEIKDKGVILSCDPYFGNAIFASQYGEYTKVPICEFCKKRGDRKVYVQNSYVDGKYKNICTECLKTATSCCRCGNIGLDKEKFVSANKIISKLFIKSSYNRGSGGVYFCKKCSAITPIKCVVCNRKTSWIDSLPLSTNGYNNCNLTICLDCIDSSKFKE